MKNLLTSPRVRLIAALIIAPLAASLAIAQEPALARPSGLTRPASSVGGAQPADAIESYVSSDATAPPADMQYRIGPGDVLDIRVFNRPQLSREEVRVSGSGTIRMPLLDSEIRAVCRTEGELAGEIVRLYRKYQRNPHVDVFIKKFEAQPVAVIGAVNAPGRFQLQRRIRLLELLTYAGGPSTRAGRVVQIVHTTPETACDAVAPAPATATAAPAATDTTSSTATATAVAATTTAASPDAADASLLVSDNLVSFKLTNVLEGGADANPFVRPGDIITITEADQAYIVGNVNQPQPIILKQPVTVSQAIAMAGGTREYTKKNQVRIYRQLPDGKGKKEIIVDLKAIEKRQAEDIALQANDIIDVPTSSGKKFFGDLIGGAVPQITRLPTSVIR